MDTQVEPRRTPARMTLLFDRLGTLVLSVVLALIVWLIAINQENPLVQQVFPNELSIQVRGLTEDLQPVQDLSTQTVRVTVRAPSNSWETLDAEDFDASINLAGLGPGEHTVPVEVNRLDPQVEIINRQPAELRVTLDGVLEKDVPVRVNVMDSPAFGYEVQESIYEPLTVTVSGPATQVNQVVAARVEVFLYEAKSQIERVQPVTAINSQSQPVTQVRIEPSLVRAIVPVEQRPGRKEVAVRPNLIGQPATGYRLSSVRVEPSTVVLLGASEALAEVPGFIETAEIDLDGATGTVARREILMLPNGVTTPDGNTVQVTATVTPIEGGKTVKQKPVVQGLGPGLEARVALETVEVILSGPQALLDSMEPDDMFVLLDLTGLIPGSHTVRPRVILPENIRQEGVLPETVEVVITSTATATPAVEASPSPGATATEAATGVPPATSPLGTPSPLASPTAGDEAADAAGEAAVEVQAAGAAPGTVPGAP